MGTEYFWEGTSLRRDFFEKLPDNSYLTEFGQTRNDKSLQKQFWKLDSNPKKPHVLWSRKIPYGVFPKPL
jgi:hypothetical protein